jgi:excisionase family DNA binding protein
VSTPSVIISTNPAGSVQKRAYSIAEACTVLGLAKNSIKRLIDNRSLPAIHIGRRLLILAEDLDALLARVKAGEKVDMKHPGVKAPSPARPPAPAKKPLSPRLKAHLDRLNSKPRKG